MAPLLALVAAIVVSVGIWYGIWAVIGVARWPWGG